MEVKPLLVSGGNKTLSGWKRREKEVSVKADAQQMHRQGLKDIKETIQSLKAPMFNLTGARMG